MRHGFVRAHQGCLHHLEAGKGPALVLLHGASAFPVDDPALIVCEVIRLIGLPATKQV